MRAHSVRLVPRGVSPIVPRTLPRAGRWLAGAAVAAVVGLGAPEARAGDFADLGTGLIVVGGVLVAFGTADAVFVANDLVDLANGYAPDKGWALAEAIVSGPQTVGFNIALFAFGHDEDDDSAGAIFVGVPFTAMATSLSIHGIWVSTGDQVPNSTLVGASVFSGTAMAWTSAALGRATRGGLFPRWIGAAEVALSSPGLAVGIYESLPGRLHQGIWAPVAAWNGLLWLHGVASMIANDEGPPGRGTKAASSSLDRPALARSSFSWAVTPTVLQGPFGPAPGVGVGGVF